MGQQTGDGRTAVEQRGDRELVATRIFDAPVQLVFDAWSKPELFQLWWVPKSNPMPLLGCEMDVRTGGGYRLTFQLPDGRSMDFFGKYLEVTPPSKMVWTNDEGGDDGSVTTVTFEDAGGGRTRLVLQEVYASKEALDQSAGAMDAAPEQFAQLDELLARLAAEA